MKKGFDINIKAPGLTTEMWPVEKLVHYARNPRKNDAQVERMVASIKEFGFRIPVVAKSDGSVVDGHLRLKAAVALGMYEVPVALADNLTDAQVKAFRLLANRSANWAEWDNDLLALELSELGDMGFDMALTGFDEGELAALLADKTVDGLTDPDDVPDTPAEPVTFMGDVWVLGSHRIMCGSSLVATDVDRLMAGRGADMVWTDPPYGVSYVGKTKDALTIENDSLDDEHLEDFLRDAFGLAFGITRAGGAWYVAAPPGPLHHVFSTVLKGLGVWRQTLNWVKSSMVLGRSDYHYQHEPIFYGWKPGAAHMWHADRKQTTVLNFDKPSRNGEHPTMKPVELVAYCLGNSSSPGQVVYEPFSGSGTTIIAAEMTGRCCYAMELSPAYVDVAVNRWEQFTGKKAVLEGRADA